MTTHPTVEDVHNLSEDDALRLVLNAKPLELLAWPPDTIRALPHKVRRQRRERLLGSAQPLTIGSLQTVMQRSRGDIGRLRNKFLATGQVADDALPAPDPELSDPGYKQPGDSSSARGSGTPRWRLGVILQWLNDTRRADEDLVLRPGGRKPPGRPPAVPAAHGSQ